MLAGTAILSHEAARFVLLGFATGALTALVALSLVIVHRVSGVLNFAAASLGAIGAFVCYSLRDAGCPTPVAVGIGLIVGVMLGAVMYAVMAVLRKSSLLSRLIATLALLSAAEKFMQVFWSNQLIQPQPFLPSGHLILGDGVSITADRLTLIGIVAVLAFGLRLIYSRTIFGLATSAVSENRMLAATFGWAPDQIELFNYLIAGFLSALAAILLAPIVTLNAAVLSMAVLPALAAALVGRFSSFGITVAAALVIGALQGELSLFQPDIARTWHVSTASLTGLPMAVPLVVILVVAVASGRFRPSRWEITSRLPLPGSGRVHRVPLILAIAVGAVLIFSAPSYASSLITTFGVGIIVASVVIVSGYAGQLSLCQYALAGFGAWAGARSAHSLGVPFLLAVVIGVTAATALGVLVALPSLRTRGVTLAIVTLAFSLVVSAMIFENASLTGGFEGIVVKRPEIFGYQVDPTMHPQRYAVLMFIALLLVGMVVANLRVGATGRRMIAVRSNERAAAGLGISVTGVKLYAFAVGAGIAGLGGVLLAFQQTNVQFTSFDVFGSILIVQLAVIGGLGWVSGVAIGAALAPGGLVSAVTNNIFSSFDVDAWLTIVGGLGVIQLLRQAPDGLASVWAAKIRRFARVPARSPPSAPPVNLSANDRFSPSGRGRVLDVRRLSVSFGGIIAVSDVSFSVTPGEVVGLVGPNGAGKTTLLDLITGFTRQRSGTVMLDSVDVSRWSPERRSRAGMARSWQSIELFEELTVRENLCIANDNRSRWLFLRDLVFRQRASFSSSAEALVDSLALRDVLDQRPGALSYGIAKRAGIARTLIANPGVVLLDEPAAGLDDSERAALATLIRRLARHDGIAVVVVEHNLDWIVGTCDRIVVLDVGQKTADGSADEVRSNELVLSSFLSKAPEVEAR